MRGQQAGGHGRQGGSAAQHTVSWDAAVRQHGCRSAPCWKARHCIASTFLCLHCSPSCRSGQPADELCTLPQFYALCHEFSSASSTAFRSALDGLLAACRQRSDGIELIG